MRKHTRLFKWKQVERVSAGIFKSNKNTGIVHIVDDAVENFNWSRFSWHRFHTGIPATKLTGHYFYEKHKPIGVPTGLSGVVGGIISGRCEVDTAAIHSSYIEKSFAFVTSTFSYQKRFNKTYYIPKTILNYLIEHETKVIFIDIANNGCNQNLSFY